MMIRVLIFIFLFISTGCVPKQDSSLKNKMEKNKTKLSEDLRFFGNTEIVLYDEHIKDILIDSTEIELVLYIDNVQNAESDLVLTKEHLDKLEERLNLAIEEIYKNYISIGVTHKYVKHFLNDITDEDHTELGMDKSISEKEKIEVIINNLICYRAQINFGYEKSFFTYDFSIGEKRLTNYVLNVVYDSKLQLNYIAEES